ncbi:MAG: aldehyde dehydrogenase family protein, partial [Coprobacillus sp.]
MDTIHLLQQHRDFFKTQKTLDIQYRINLLKKIKKWIIDNDQVISKALSDDLGKQPVESYMSEIGMVLSEINFQIKHIKRWSKNKKVWTPLAQFYATSYESYQPYGVVLVMSPWNYPFLLSIEPTIGAIAAGNCVVIKPSENAPHTSALVKMMIDETCCQQHVSVVEGGIEVNTELLNQRFDYIFFTGSEVVGKIVMEKASHYLTPLTLELGGKSPCIVDDDKSLRLAVKRIAFGKFLNAGQTCVAPDYLLIKDNLKEQFITYMKEIITEFFGDSPLTNQQLVRIINQRHFERLSHLLENQDIVIGGKCDLDNLKIEPTVVDHIDSDNILMKEEIFGPILPII